MNRYEIRCTPEQTRKALELGAPLEIKYGSIAHKPSIEELQYLLQYDNMWYKIPTSDQMIGWLEEQGLFVDVVTHFDENDKHLFTYYVSHDFKSLIECEMKHIAEEMPTYHSRREATLSAIDEALEYLLKNKNN